VEDSIVGFKKAVDEFMDEPRGIDYFHLEGDFHFPSIVRYHFANRIFIAGGTKIVNPAKLIGIEDTYSFSVYGQANIPHIRHVKISEIPTNLGTGILEERSFKLAITVPPNIAKNSIELMRSGQYRTTPSSGPENSHIRIRFDLYNIKANHKGRPIFDVGRIYIYKDG